ncbi:MAG: YhcG family protein [Salibacteraceae bacterium]
MKQPGPHQIKLFADVVQQIKQVRQKMFVQINTEMIDLYWDIGETISQQIENSSWGKGIVKELSAHIAKHVPGVKGFSDKNLWRMKQFYETYKEDKKVSTALRELTWSHHLSIFSRCKSQVERHYYLDQCLTEKYSVRELNRQISAGVFERSLTGKPKVSTALKELYPQVENLFKDQYTLEFLGLPDTHSENDLQKAILKNMKAFIMELGHDFVFVAEKFRLQVGNQDFYIDLLFFHRELSALVAFELKIGKFSPQHLGQLNFYLEALDRDVKKLHENPSIGILMCRDQDDEVVEYALSRNLSPTLVARYQLQLPDKQVIQQKLSELLSELPPPNEVSEMDS